MNPQNVGKGRPAHDSKVTAMYAQRDRIAPVRLRLSLGTALLACALVLSHPALSLAAEPIYEDACGVAYRDGLYVSDYYHDTIELPDEGKIANEAPGDGPCQLALDPAGDLYVNNWHQDVVKYSAGDLVSGAGAVIDPGRATGVAVDPLSGNLYVDRRTYIALYKAPVQSGEDPSAKIGTGHLGEGYGLAVSSHPASVGDIYVADASDNTVKVFNLSTSESEPIAVMGGAATPQRGFHHLSEGTVAVDDIATSPAYGRIYVLDNIGFGSSEHPEGAVDEFNAAGDYRGQHKGFKDAEPSGMTVEDPFGNIAITSGNSEGSKVITFGPPPPGDALTVRKTGSGGGTVDSSPFGIACGEACIAEYNADENLTLFATPDAHSNFTGWSGAACSGIGDCGLQLFGNVEVTANFEAAPEQTLTVSTLGAGTLTSKPAGISCPGHCAEEFAEDHTITLIAKPASHTRIVFWSGCSSRPNITECKVTMSEAKSISVQFAPIPPQTLSVSVVGPGEVLSYPGGVSCPGSCSAQFDEGSTVYLIASPDPGFIFAGWRGSGCSGAGLCLVRMDEAESWRAEFVKELPIESLPAEPTRGTTLLPTPRIALRRVALKGHIALAASVSSTGRLSILNHWLRPIALEPSAGGVVTLPLRLNASGRAALRRSRHHRLQVKVTVVFMPTYRGTPAEATTRVTFGGNGRHH